MKFYYGILLVVVFALGMLFLTMQGVSNFIRDLYFVIRGEPIDRT